MKQYEVFIYDQESGCCQSIKCEARTSIDAGDIGDSYIKKWNLTGGMITDIREVIE